MATTARIAKTRRTLKYKIRQRNRCRRCGRPRGYLRKFALCRICFRDLAREGYPPGRDQGELVRRSEHEHDMDPIADLLTRIRNAHLAKHDRVDVPTSKLKVEICRILQERGLHPQFQGRRAEAAVGAADLPASTTRRASRRSPICRRVSSPGGGVYRGAEEIRPVLDGLGLGVVSTNLGVLSDARRATARRRRDPLRGLVRRERCRESEECRSRPQGGQGADRRDDVFMAEGPEGQGRASAAAPASRSRSRTASFAVERPSDEGPERAKHGLIRALLANAVNGVGERLHARARHHRRRLPGRGQGAR